RLMGYPTHTILRRDLLAVLLSHAARAGIDVLYGHRAPALDLDDGGRAVARFDNWRECNAMDRVIRRSARKMRRSYCCEGSVTVCLFMTELVQ
ncbi:hypothetical protein SB751_29830, partial [Cupriavidus sp. SIMBA_020]